MHNSSRQPLDRDAYQIHGLLRHGANVDATADNVATRSALLKLGVYGDLSLARTPLQVAVQQDDAKSVEMLLDAGAQVNVTDNIGNTALAHMYAEQFADEFGPFHRSSPTRVTQLLLDHGARIDDTVHVHHSGEKVQKLPILVILARKQEGFLTVHPAAMDLLMDHGADITAQDERGFTAFFYIAVRGCVSDEVAPFLKPGRLETVAAQEPSDSAKACLFSHLTLSQRVRLAAQRWESIVSPLAGIGAAWMVVCLESWATGRKEAASENEFEKGAHLLVAKARCKYKLPKQMFRFVEVMVLVAFSLGSVLIWIRWTFWVPVVVVLSVPPALTSRSCKQLLHNPLLFIGTPNTRAGNLASLSRLLLLFGLYICIGISSQHQVLQVNSYLFTRGGMKSFYSPQRPKGLEVLVNPKATDIDLVKATSLWPESSLKQDLPSWAPWAVKADTWLYKHSGLQRFLCSWFYGKLYELGDILPTTIFVQDIIAGENGDFLVANPNKDVYFPEAGSIDAGDVYMLGMVFLFLLVPVYAMALMCRLLCTCLPHSDAEMPSEEYVERLLAGEDVEDVARDLKGLKPVQTLSCRCSFDFFDSLYVILFFVGLDIFFDLNTIFTLIITENYWFAFFLSIIVARSFLKQLGLDSLPQAWTKTVQVRMMHRQLLEFFDEEKGSEAFFSLAITAYSYCFCVQGAKDALTQWFSIFLSAYGIAGYLVQKIDLDMDCEDTRMDRDIAKQSELLLAAA